MSGTMFASKRVFALDDAVEVAELDAVAAKSDWALQARGIPGFDEWLQLQWNVDPNTSVEYTENHSEGVRFVAVQGNDSHTVEATAQTITEAVATQSAGDLLTVLDANHDDPVLLVRTWRSFATVTSQAQQDDPIDPRLVSTVERHLGHENRQVRMRTLMVCDTLVARWPQLSDPVIARKGVETELNYVVEALADARTDQ